MDDPSIYEMELVDLWAVHSQKEDRPVLRGWAKSEADANTLMDKMRSSDEEPDDRYWVEQMTEHDYNVYKAAGVLPAEA